MSCATRRPCLRWLGTTPGTGRLARLWQSQDKRQDAYDLLAPVYGWFTEGFDTADLMEAKALVTFRQARLTFHF